MVKGTSQLFVAGPPVVARARRGRRQGEARRQRHPRAQRRGRRRGRHRGGGVRRAPAGSCRTCRRRSTTCRRAAEPTDDPRAARRVARRRPSRSDRRKVYKVRADHRVGRRRRLVPRDRAGWGRIAVTGLARLDGWPVAVLANDPYFYGGGLDRRRRPRRSTRFVDLADTFHLPVVHLVDSPGFVIGTEAEQRGDHPPRRARARRRLPGAGAVVLGDPAQGLRRGRRRAPERVAAARTATRGRRATGARCRSKAASRPRTRRSSRQPTTRRRCAPRSRRGSTSCARRSAPPRRSSSRRSSTRATPARCCASSPTSPRRCAPPAASPTTSARKARTDALRTRYALPIAHQIGSAGSKACGGSLRPPMLDHVFTDAISALREAFEGAFLERQAFEEHFQVDVLLGDVTWETSYGLPGEGLPPRVVAHITFDWPTWSQTSYRRWYVDEVFDEAPAIEMEIVFRVQRLDDQPRPAGFLRRAAGDRARRSATSGSSGPAPTVEIAYDDDMPQAARVTPSRSPTRACTSWPRRRWPTARAGCSTSTSAPSAAGSRRCSCASATCASATCRRRRGAVAPRVGRGAGDDDGVGA